MFWDKNKKEKGLPDLPPMKALPPLPIKLKNEVSEEEMPEKHALPTFPDSPNSSGFSQAAIKDAITTEETTKEPMEFPNTPSRIQTYELEEWKPRTAPPTAKMSFPTQTIKEKNSDIFVKIDKFHSARRSLADIEDKLEEISGLLSKIREMKMREEQELSSWEKDLVALKTKMEEVNSSIFEKVD